VNAPAVDLQRRHAIKLGGLSLAFVWLGAAGRAQAFINARPQSGDAAAASADGNPAFAPNAFIRVDAEGPVRLVMPNVEMGQGIYTGACAMLAEELGVGMDQIKVEHAPPNQALYGIPLLGEQATGGSTSTRDHWTVLREAGAVARTMLGRARRRGPRRQRPQARIRRAGEGGRSAADTTEGRTQGSGSVHADRKASAADRFPR
jgi:isoquinoline 1-oxidoreductase beta subunit